MGSAPGLSVSNRTMLWVHVTFTLASYNIPDPVFYGEKSVSITGPGKPGFHLQGSRPCTLQGTPAARPGPGSRRHP